MVVPPHKKIFFASDFHLGYPDVEQSLQREKKIVEWLKNIQSEAYALFLLGDVFHYWFEYHQVVPKGYVRFLGQLAHMVDQGVKIFLFVGNHDIWYQNYFPQFLGVQVVKHAASLWIDEKKYCIGHGDLLAGNLGYVMLRCYVYDHAVLKWLYQRLPSRLGLGCMQSILKLRASYKFFKQQPTTVVKDAILTYCQQVIEPVMPHDVYVFGHQHQPLAQALHAKAWYYNVGDWLQHDSYVVVAQQQIALKQWHS